MVGSRRGVVVVRVVVFQGGAAFLLGVGIHQLDQRFGIQGGQRAPDQDGTAAVGLERQMPARSGRFEFTFESCGFAFVGPDRVQQLDQPTGQPRQTGRVELVGIPDHQLLGLAELLGAEVGGQFGQDATDGVGLLERHLTAHRRLSQVGEPGQVVSLPDEPVRLPAGQPLVRGQPGRQRHPRLVLGRFCLVGLARKSGGQGLSGASEPDRRRHQREPVGVRQETTVGIEPVEQRGSLGQHLAGRQQIPRRVHSSTLWTWSDSFSSQGPQVNN